MKVIKIEGKGKGLVATRKVAAGDVLLQEMPLMVIDSIDSEVSKAFTCFYPVWCLILTFLKVSSDHFKLEFEVLGEATQKKVLELFDPVKDDLKLELLENINEVEAGIRKGREEDPDNQELGELVQRMGELGAGIIRWLVEDERRHIWKCFLQGGRWRRRGLHKSSENFRSKQHAGDWSRQTLGRISGTSQGWHITKFHRTLDCIVSLLRCVRLAPSIPPQREPFTTTYPSLITGPGLFIMIFVIFQCTFFSCNPNAVWSWTKGNFRKKVVIFHSFICIDGDGLTVVLFNLTIGSSYQANKKGRGDLGKLHRLGGFQLWK